MCACWNTGCNGCNGCSGCTVCNGCNVCNGGTLFAVCVHVGTLFAVCVHELNTGCSVCVMVEHWLQCVCNGGTLVCNAL